MCSADIPSAYAPGRELSPHLTFLDRFTYPQQKSAHSLLILGFSNQEVFTLGSSPVKWLKPWCSVPPALGSYILTRHMVGGLTASYFTLSSPCHLPAALFSCSSTHRAEPNHTLSKFHRNLATFCASSRNNHH